MITDVTFAGFKPELVLFLSELAKNNNREWFEAHRADYETYLVEPARQLVMAIGALLPKLGSDIHAEPRIRGSIFAINRDIRCAKDKTPYKTYLDLWFWQGDGPSRERPGYFFRLSQNTLMLGAGMHAFSDDALERFRQAILDLAPGADLERIARALHGRGIDVAGQTYKRVPVGLPPDHPRADWLRYSGLFTELEQPLPESVFSDQLPGVCFEQYQRVAPLQQWLVDLLAD